MSDQPAPSSTKHRVLIVEDHPMFRERLATLINRDLGMAVCGETDNIRSAEDLIATVKPDIAIVDITLRGSSGLELVKNLKAQRITLPILILSMHEESLYAERAIRAGARGYVSKNEAASKVVDAIKKVLGGEIYVSAHIMTRILYKMQGSNAGPAADVEALTDRELEVFHLVGCGKNTREIAALLNLGETTVETYKARIKDKLGIRHAPELCQRAVQWLSERATSS